ncbi:hypothetical protein CDL15_Pgr011253 [Punica granatum]|uniref:Uncharacterized protein n=1 Tax=Punica granatum TaxID=22663 RepID=A0A218WEM2_PUNGR|nr:hypothetical protein CDL15_Pgr011253 [Punica granatum]
MKGGRMGRGKRTTTVPPPSHSINARTATSPPQLSATCVTPATSQVSRYLRTHPPTVSCPFNSNHGRCSSARSSPSWRASPRRQQLIAAPLFASSDGLHSSMSHLSHTPQS